MPVETALRRPVVLLHGLCGFDRIFAFRRPVAEYFPGVRAYLEALGNRVLAPRVSPTASVAARAAQIRTFLKREVGSEPVHLFGHSMGGLDARHMISRLGMDAQVLSLTTIGTPHRGSAFADWGVARFARLLRPLFRAVGLADDAFFDLTSARCREFNDRVPDAPGVRYFSVAGRCEAPWVGPAWAFPHKVVARAEGPNDGVVSVASAAWGEDAAVWPGDHLNIVNWPNREARRRGVWEDRAAAYGGLVARLRALGF